MFGRERLELKTTDEVVAMRRAGLVVARTLEHLRDVCREGMTTAQLDGIARERIEAQGARPSFPEVPGYRHTLCVSVGPAVVHGIPGEQVIAAGDIVSIDCGAILDGWHGDAAISILVGGPEAAGPEAAGLVSVTEGALSAGIAAMRTGNRVGDIGAAVEGHIEREGVRAGVTYGVVEQFEGHGIGREMHMEPGVPNVAVKRRGPKLGVGATLAIEPMVTLGSPETRELDDGWTAVTVDGSLAAHVEHTVAITPDGIWVLTALDGGERLLEEAGAPFGPLRADAGPRTISSGAQ